MKKKLTPSKLTKFIRNSKSVNQDLPYNEIIREYEKFSKVTKKFGAKLGVGTSNLYNSFSTKYPTKYNRLKLTEAFRKIAKRSNAKLSNVTIGSTNGTNTNAIVNVGLKKK